MGRLTDNIYYLKPKGMNPLVSIPQHNQLLMETRARNKAWERDAVTKGKLMTSIQNDVISWSKKVLDESEDLLNHLIFAN